MTGLPDDPSDRPTRMTDYGTDGWQQVLEEQSPGGADAGPDFAPDPWYRNRVLLALWALMVALLLTLIIYGTVELSRGGGTSVPAPHTSTTITPTRSSTTSPSSTTTTPPTTTTTTEAPPPETSEQTSEQAPPPPATNSPAPTETPRHHHHWHLPHLF